MAPTRINGLPRRDGASFLDRLYKLLVTEPSDFYRSGGMSRILQRALETILGDEGLEPESLYASLSMIKRRAVKRVDRYEQNDPMLAQVLRAPTLESYLRSTTDVTESIRRISEIVSNKQNKLLNAQLVLLEKLNPIYRGLESRKTDELDEIIKHEEIRLNERIGEPSGLTRYVPTIIRSWLGSENYIQIPADDNRFNNQDLKQRMFDERLQPHESDAPRTIPNEALGIILKLQKVSKYHELKVYYQKAVKNANIVLSGLEALADQSALRKTASRGILLLSERFGELAIKYGPAVLGIATLAAGGFVLSQSIGYQIDAFQTQLNLLTEQYINTLNIRESAYISLQATKDTMAQFKDAVIEHSIVDKGQGLWNIVKELLTELNPNSVISNQNIADAVAKVSEANGMMTPAEWADKFPQHVYPHGDYLADIARNPHLVYPGQHISLDALTQSSQELFERNIQTAQSAYDAALKAANGLESQMRSIPNQVSVESNIIIKNQPVYYEVIFSKLFKDPVTVIAAISSPVFLGLGIRISAHKENGFFNNIIPKLRAYFT